MENLSEKEIRKENRKKTTIRVFAYIFCIFLLWFGVDKLTNSPTTLTNKLKGFGVIAAACVYLFIDIRGLISKNKFQNR